MTPIEILLEDQPSNEKSRRAQSQDCSYIDIKTKAVIAEDLIGITFKGAHVETCNFSHSYFDRCYFRKTVFKNVSFNGCKFKDCTFDGAEFFACDLSYAEFQNCSVKYEQMETCLPTQQNVLRELARNLRMNARIRGDNENHRKFLMREIAASELHNRYKWSNWNDRYYQKYTFGQRVTAFFAWVGSKIAGFVWGHGESPWLVVRFAGLAVLAFALLYWTLSPIKDMPAGCSFHELLLYSLATFTTLGYGQATPVSIGGRILANVEAALGLILYGVLVATLYTRFSKR